MLCHYIEKAQSSFLSLPRSGILLSQFLQETEKKKKKSKRSSQSCQIRKRAVTIEFLRTFVSKTLGVTILPLDPGIAEINDLAFMMSRPSGNANSPSMENKEV